jgi:small subunit ribosomal protein S16
MVKIRLRRVGKKKQPSYRVVVADSRSPRDGRFIETIGHYNPRTDPPTIEIKEERALHWLSHGAQPTEAVERMLKNMGTFEKLKQVRQGVSIQELVTSPATEAEPVEAAGEAVVTEEPALNTGEVVAEAAAMVTDIAEEVEVVKEIAEQPQTAAAEAPLEEAAEAMTSLTT